MPDQGSRAERFKTFVRYIDWDDVFMWILGALFILACATVVVFLICVLLDGLGGFNFVIEDYDYRDDL